MRDPRELPEYFQLEPEDRPPAAPVEAPCPPDNDAGEWLPLLAIVAGAVVWWFL